MVRVSLHSNGNPKCTFGMDSEPKFQNHIPQHQVDSSTGQSLLCGLCYTFASSLNCHQFIVHKVRDQEEEVEKEIVEVRVEVTDPEACSGEEAIMETTGNLLEECAIEPLVTDLEPRSIQCLPCTFDSNLSLNDYRLNGKVIDNLRTVINNGYNYYILMTYNYLQYHQYIPQLPTIFHEVDIGVTPSLSITVSSALTKQGLL
ncbi:zinc finger protein [Cricetulus griseus]|uniref:Zinc finger protein n=1 Tax=Cricetulus griseus TaxID=10029 RepID=A0A061I4M8_CRIGR|nr:zinc finger protein [Cricetulus griseus]